MRRPCRTWCLCVVLPISWLAVRLFAPQDVHEDGPYCNMALKRNHMNASGWQSDRCHVHRYTPAEAVECLSALNRHRSEERRSEHPVHFAFVGDSRARLQFFSFLQTIPDFDADWWSLRENPFDRTRSLHFPILIQSKLLNVIISYNWAPLINDWLKNLLDGWNTPPHTGTPDYIFIGLSSHYMLTMNGKDLKTFEGNLTELSSKFKLLSSVSHLFWLNQYPTIDFWGMSGSFNADVSVDKMFQYDQRSRQILQDSGVRFWDSNHPLIEEYIRSCQLADRYDGTRFRQCSDYIHAGFLALDQGTHSLYNFVCNRFLSQSSHPAAMLTPGTCCT